MNAHKYIRDIVFGFGDGINTSLGIVAGVGGAQIQADIVILAALIGMFTGAKAMAVQNYLAIKSEKEVLGTLEGHPVKSAIVMFISFLVGGILPILPYFAVKYGLFNSNVAIVTAVMFSIMASFTMGGVKGRMANKNWVRSGIEMAGLGTGVALVGYGLGSEFVKIGILNIHMGG
jgi:VIT1/CCC1 family predicted Fe2+/Mn2+ transporter